MADFTGNRIKDTYQRVVQIEGGTFQDGLGNPIDIPFSQLSGTGTLISSSTQLSSDISGSFNSLSSSITSRISSNESNITNLQNFSSSLDATFATDLQLENISSSFATTIDNIQHTDITALNTFTSSIQSEVDSLNAASSSFLTGIDAGIISSSKQITDFGFISSSHTDIAALNLFTSSIQLEVNGLNAATSSYLTGIGDGIISSSKQISDFGFISSSHTDIAALNNFSSSIQTQVDGLVAATGSYITTLSAQTLNELSDVNDYTSSAIIDGYRLAWDSGSQEWAPAPSNTLKGTTRLFISTVRSNSSSFFFNSITRTATDSASPVADSAFLLTSALLNKVTIYLRNDAASANTCTVEVFKNSNGIDFGLASSLASDVQTLTTDTIQTFTFTGLTLAQFDSLHFKVTPTIAGGQYYGIVIIE